MAGAGEVAAKPVEDLGHKVDGAVSVGEDLEFQERWWKFENIVWSVFAVLLVLDLLGVFGRGWAAKAKARTGDNALQISYERIERTMTPSVMQVRFGPDAAVDGKYKLFVSASLVGELGNRRIAPEPEASAVGDGGFVYTFPALGQPAIITFSLEPASPGIYHWKLGVPGGEMVQKRVVVVP